MRKTINIIARYAVGVWGLALLFLLACIFQEESIFERFGGFALILFFCMSMVVFCTYGIHFIWMAMEKRRPKNLKADVFYALTLIGGLLVYDVYMGRFRWNGIWKQIIFVVLVMIFSEVGRYIYSWEEE